MKKEEITNSAELFLYKAEIDFNTGTFLLNALKNEEINIDEEKILFEFQQSAEKLLKALLSFHGINFPKIHDLEGLINICKENKIDLIEQIEKLEELTDYAVDGRYDIILEDCNDLEIYSKILEKFLFFCKKEIIG